MLFVIFNTIVVLLAIAIVAIVAAATVTMLVDAFFDYAIDRHENSKTSNLTTGNDEDLEREKEQFNEQFGDFDKWI